MPRIIVCGGPDTGISAIIERLSDEGFDMVESGDTHHGLSGLAQAARAADLAVLTEAGDEAYSQLLALSVLGVKRVIPAEETSGEFRDNAEALGVEILAAVPQGDLPAALKSITDDAVTSDNLGPFRFPVTDVDGNTLSGTVSGGAPQTGDAVVVLPGAKTGAIASIEEDSGRPTRLVIDGVADIKPGAMICAAADRALMSDQFRTRIIWLADDPLLPSRPYALRTANRTVAVSITDLKHIINPRSLEHEAGATLSRDQIGVCNLALAEPIAFDPADVNRATGGFSIVDNQSGELVAVGAIEFGLYRADNIHWQSLSVDKAVRSEMKGQKPAVLWFTGLSGSGKSTIADLVEQKLHAIGRHTYTLDGDNVRHGLNKNLGFTDADRVENIRRVAETSKLMADAGLICMVSFISPFRAERRMARELLDDGEFIEVFVNTPIEICEQRDPKGLYKKARAGEIKNFTGFDSPYDEPENPELDIPTETMSPEDAADAIIDYLSERGFIRA